MKGFFFLIVFYCFGLIACSTSYKVYEPTYKEIFSSAPAIPNYADLRYWAAHPWKKDPSDSLSSALKGEPIDSSVDVFFLHPTTLTDKALEGVVWNADINDAALNLKTDYTSILYQASVFNHCARVFAPRYRQAHLYSFYSKDTVASKAALELAYQDVKQAFEYYMAHNNHGRPIIIASHSQGTLHAGRLLKEYFENKPLQKQLVCAYIIGLAIPNNYFSVLEPCNNPKATGCVMGWRTFREGYLPEFVQTEKNKSWVVNPLSWTTDETTVSRKENKGAILLKYNKKYKHTNGAQIHDGVLWINKPKFPGGVFIKEKNYHPGDINFFYISIRENATERIRSYFTQTNH